MSSAGGGTAWHGLGTSQTGTSRRARRTAGTSPLSCAWQEARARPLSHTQREVLEQLEHAAMPFLERASTGAAGLVVTPSGRRRFGFILTPDELVLIDDGDVCATALGRSVEDRAPLEGPVGALCALLRELLRDHPARLSRMREDFELVEQQGPWRGRCGASRDRRSG